MGGNLLHKIDAQRRSVSEVIWGEGKILDRILEQHCGCNLKQIGSSAHVTAVVVAAKTSIEKCPTKLHAPHSITDKRMSGGIHSLNVAEMLLEINVLRGKHSFAAHIVGIHTFPASRQCAAVEYHHQSKIVGI